MKTKWVAALAAGLIGAGVMSSARAGLIAYDGFDFPQTANTGDSLIGQTTGTGWTSDGWTATADTVSTVNTGASLSSTANPLSANAVGGYIQKTKTGTGNAGLAHHLFSGPAFDLTGEGTTLYMSFLMEKFANGGSSNDNIELDFEDSTKATGFRVGMGSAETWTVGPASAVNTGIAAAVGSVYYVLVKVTAHTSVSDEYDLKFYAPGSTAPTAEPTSWDYTYNSGGIGVGSIGGVRLVTGTNATGAVDEIRIGTTFNDMISVPEPVSACSMLFAAAGLLGRRRSA